MELLGVKINNLDKKSVIAKLGEFLSSDNFHLVVTVNAEILVTATENKQYAQILNQADLNIVDGSGPQIILALKYKQKIYRWPGVDLLGEIIKQAAARQQPVLLLGSSSFSNQKTAEKFKQKYPNLDIFSLPGGEIYFDQTKEEWQQDKNIINFIKEKKPAVILAALGHPKQEFWLYHHRHLFPSVKVAVGVGGSFDFISGKTKRAPLYLRKLGLEWLWRFLFEPWRIKRIYNATFKFIYLVVKYSGNK